MERCRNCGKEIQYDKEDGYWDNLVEKLDGSIFRTPFNCRKPHLEHEPFTKNEIVYAILKDL